MPGEIWKRVTVQVPDRMFDAVSDFLATLTGRGVCSREGDDTVFIDAWLAPEKADEQLARIRFYLDDVLDRGTAADGKRLDVEEIPEEDWMSVFRSQHRPVRISDRLVVRPAWCQPVGANDVVIDPGMAFGTGSHPTTSMCLELLDGLQGAPRGGRLLDLGTGSGILAISGAFLGYGSVLAVDIDPVAVEVAAGNVKSNRVEKTVSVREGGIEEVEGVYDVITANLSGSLLLESAGKIVPHLADKGYLIISGITVGEEGEIAGAFAGAGLEPVRAVESDVWAAMMFKKE